MSAKILGTYRIGADITVALMATQGDPGQVTNATAALRRAVQGTENSIRFEEGSQSIPMIIAPRAASDSVPAGWNVTLPAAQSASLMPGLYAIDAKLVLGDQVTITSRSAAILVTQAAVV